MSPGIDVSKLRDILLSRRKEGEAKTSLAALVFHATSIPLQKAAPQTVVGFLGELSLFQGFTKRELARLARIAHERSYGDGETVADQGTPSAAMYVVRSGTVELTRRRSNGEEVGFATLGPGEQFGDVALLVEEMPRVIGTRSRGLSGLLAFSRSDVEDLIREYPATGVKLLRALSRLAAMRLIMLTEEMEGKES
jgi:CRP-like cAMP-binding protein